MPLIEANGSNGTLHANGNGVSHANGKGVALNNHTSNPPTKLVEKTIVNLSLVGNVVNPYTYEYLLDCATHILSRTSLRPKIAIICGSGLGSLAGCLEQKVEFPYETIPHFPQSTVPGHVGKLVVGMMGSVPVVCMQGRFHYYEGYPLYKCAMPVRVFKLLGVEMMVVTNAAGGLNPDYRVGDIMIIKDHVNFPTLGGDSTLRGPNDDMFGPRFIAMNKAYDFELRKLAKEIASDLGMDKFVHEGVYTMVGGPSFETVSELKLMRILQIDAVGMSTVPEVVAARHCGIKVFGFSLITNECIVEFDHHDEANHEEVMEAANRRTNDLVKFTSTFVAAAAEKLSLQ